MVLLLKEIDKEFKRATILYETKRDEIVLEEITTKIKNHKV